MLDVIPFPGSTMSLWSEDVSLTVARRGPAFQVSGKVEHEFPHGTTLHLASDALAEELEIPLALSSTPADAVEALRKNLPRGLMIDVRPSPEPREAREPNDVVIRLIETVVPAATLPEVRVFCTDPSLRARMIEANVFDLEGTTETHCVVSLQIDSHRLAIPLPGRFPASLAAARIARSIPHGYFARAEGVRVSIWKNADCPKLAA